MIRTFLKNSTIYFTSNAINKVIGLLFFAYVARLFTKEEMGAYGLLNQALMVLSVLMTLQIHSGFQRYYLDFDERDRRPAELSTVNLLLISNLAMGVILLLLRRPLWSAAVVETPLPLFVVLLGLPFAQGVVMLFTAKLRLQNRALTVSILSLLQVLTYVGSTLLLLRLGVDRLQALFTGMLAQSGFVIACYLIDLRTWRPTLRLSLILPSIRFSAMLVPSGIGAYLALLVGKSLIARMLDFQSLGTYEATNRVAIIVLTIMEPLWLATTPIIFAQYRQADFARRHRLLLAIHVAVLIGLVATFTLFDREVVQVVVGRKYAGQSYLIYPFVLVSFLLHLTHWPAVNVHLAQKTQWATCVELTCAGVNVGTTYLLLSWLGLPGAIGAVVITYSLRYVLYLTLGNRLYPPLRIHLGLALGAVAGCVLLLIVHALLRNLPLAARIPVLLAEGTLVMVGFMRLYDIRWTQLPSLLRRT